MITDSDRHGGHGSWRETGYLLRSPANVRCLLAAVARDEAGAPGVTTTLEELRETTGGS